MTATRREDDDLGIRHRSRNSLVNYLFCLIVLVRSLVTRIRPNKNSSSNFVIVLLSIAAVFSKSYNTKAADMIFPSNSVFLHATNITKKKNYANVRSKNKQHGVQEEHLHLTDKSSLPIKQRKKKMLKKKKKHNNQPIGIATRSLRKKSTEKQDYTNSVSKGGQLNESSKITGTLLEIETTKRRKATTTTNSRFNNHYNESFIQRHTQSIKRSNKKKKERKKKKIMMARSNTTITPSHRIASDNPSDTKQQELQKNNLDSKKKKKKMKKRTKTNQQKLNDKTAAYHQDKHKKQQQQQQQQQQTEFSSLPGEMNVTISSPIENSKANPKVDSIVSSKNTIALGSGFDITSSTPQTTQITPWVRRLLHNVNNNNNRLRPYPILLPIPKDYISDNFNLVQLPSIIERIGRYHKDKEQETKTQADNKQLKRKKLDVTINNDLNNSNNSINKEGDDFQVNQQRTDKYSIYRQALQLLVEDHPVLFVGATSSSTPFNTITSNDDDVNNNYDINGHSKNNLHHHLNLYDAIPDYMNKAAIALYMLLHQRYVLSPRGLDVIRRKFITGMINANEKQNHHKQQQMFVIDPIFGRCPRQHCYGMPLLPIGDSDQYSFHPTDGNNDYNGSPLLLLSKGKQSEVKLYCACCNEVLYNWEQGERFNNFAVDHDVTGISVDGCAWGTSFCHLFLMIYGEELFRLWLYDRPSTSSTTSSSHVPRIFGFPLHPSSVSKQFSSSYLQ